MAELKKKKENIYKKKLNRLKNRLLVDFFRNKHVAASRFTAFFVLFFLNKEKYFSFFPKKRSQNPF